MAEPQDIDLLTRLVLAENRQPSGDEARGIVSAVLNRRELAGFPDDIAGVISQYRTVQPDRNVYQFSPMNPADPNHAVIKGAGPGFPGWDNARALVESALGGPLLPYTHYWASRISPSWAGALSDQQEHGKHTFGRENRRKKSRTKAANRGGIAEDIFGKE